MAVIAKGKITTRDKSGNVKKYDAGEVLDGLTKEEENRLIMIGSAERVKESITNTNDNKTKQPEEVKVKKK